MKDAGMKSTQESSMAKLFASEVAVRCANEGVMKIILLEIWGIIAGILPVQNIL